MLCSSTDAFKALQGKRGAVPDRIDQVHNACTGVPIRTLWHVQVVGCQQGCSTSAGIRHGVVGGPHQNLQPPFWDAAKVVGCSNRSGMQHPFWDAAIVLGCSNSAGMQHPFWDAATTLG